VQPIRRNGTTEDVAKMIAFVIDDEQASFVTGSYFLVDGGAITAGGPNSIDGIPMLSSSKN